MEKGLESTWVRVDVEIVFRPPFGSPSTELIVEHLQELFHNETIEGRRFAFGRVRFVGNAVEHPGEP